MTRDTGPAWRMEIAEGPNAGAALALPPGCYRLGSDAENDIVLCDPGIAGAQGDFDIAADGASFTPHTDGITLQHRGIAAGRAMAIASGAEIRVGSTLLRIIGPGSHQAAATSLPGARICAAFLAMGIAAAIATFVAAPPATRANAPTPAATQPPAGIESAQRAFAEHLQHAGLGGTVQVAAANGALVASGTLLAADANAWRDAQGWFDAHYGSRFSLVVKTDAAAAESTPQLDVAAISLSPIPNVITRRGERYTEGAVLPGGWSIASITAAGVTLRRGTRDIRITL